MAKEAERLEEEILGADLNVHCSSDEELTNRLENELAEHELTPSDVMSASQTPEL